MRIQRIEAALRAGARTTRGVATKISEGLRDQGQADPESGPSPGGSAGTCDSQEGKSHGKEVFGVEGALDAQPDGREEGDRHHGGGFPATSAATNRAQNRDHAGQQRENAQVTDVEGASATRRASTLPAIDRRNRFVAVRAKALCGGKGTP